MWKSKKSIGEIKLDLKAKKIEGLIDSMLEADVDIRNSPLSDEYFILDRKREVYILVSFSSIKICNHKYRYEIALPSSQSDKYIGKIKRKMELQSELVKKELFRNEINLIDSITGLYADKAKAEKLLQEKSYQDLVLENDKLIEKLWQK